MGLAHPYEFKSIIQLVTYFNTEERCLAYLEEQRWGSKPTCPHCNNESVYKFTDGKRYKCSKCRKQFTAKVGTYFESSKLPLQKWFVGLYLLTSHKKGISSHQLAKDINVTQRTAWFMLQRMRHGLGMAVNTGDELEGRVDLDETFVGGKEKNKHKDKRTKGTQGRSVAKKTAIAGMLQEKVSETVERLHKVIPGRTVKEEVIKVPARVRAFVVPDTKTEQLLPLIQANVKPGSIVISDEYGSYTGLNKDYDHRIVDHAAKVYVNENGDSSNALEGFWTWVKLAITATYMAYHAGTGRSTAMNAPTSIPP